MKFFDRFLRDLLRSLKQKDKKDPKAPAKDQSGTQQKLVFAKQKSRTAPVRRVNPKIATEDQVEEILAFPGKVLTAPECENGIVLQEVQRAITAFMEDGTLLVDQGDPLHPHVATVKQTILRKGKKITRELHVEREIIRRVYSNAQKRGGNAKADSEMQEKFIKIVKDAVAMKCSDIHFVIGTHEAFIRVRSDGIMTRYGVQIAASEAHRMLAAAFTMIEGSDPNYLPVEYQEGRISEAKNTAMPEGINALRMQFNPLIGGRHLVIRILYQTKSSKADIDSLGYAPAQIKDVKYMRKKPYGINVICGPTGSGKSTTLQSALIALIRERKGEINVLTIEDPPEYEIPGAVQLPVVASDADDRNAAFARAIKAAMRSDPDVIMIGEVRDASSADLAFKAAMTGHQVWCSLHANDAVSILDRFRGIDVDPDNMTDHTLVTGLISQRLMRKLCPHCAFNLDRALKILPDLGVELDQEMLEAEIFHHPEFRNYIRFADPRGCNAPGCKKGTAGRTVVSEVCRPDEKFMTFIKARQKNEAIRYWKSWELGNGLKGVNLLEHATSKLLSGLVSPIEIEEKVGILAEMDVNRVENYRHWITPPAAAEA